MARKQCKSCDGRGWSHEESCRTIDYRKRGIMTIMEVECNCQRPTCTSCNGSGVMARHKDRSMSDKEFGAASKMLEDSTREVCDEMSEADAWEFVKGLGEYVTPIEEWMAIYLAKKWPSVVEKLKAMEAQNEQSATS